MENDIELTIRTCFKNLFMKSWMPHLASGLRALAFTSMVPKKDFYILSRFSCPKSGVLLGTISRCGRDCVRLGFLKDI